MGFAQTTDVPILPSLGWLVLMTHVGKENYAREHLARQAFDVYLPQVLKQIRHARKTQTVLRPLFPNYLFVQVAADKIRLRALRSTFGVRKLVTVGERPAVLPSVFIDQLRAREIDGAVARPSVPFKPGESVRVVRGPFAGAVAQVLELEEKDRVIILLNLLQRQFAGKFAVQELARAGE